MEVKQEEQSTQTGKSQVYSLSIMGVSPEDTHWDREALVHTVSGIILGTCEPYRGGRMVMEDGEMRNKKGYWVTVKGLRAWYQDGEVVVRRYSQRVSSLEEAKLLIENMKGIRV